MKIRRGLTAANALDPDSQNETGGVDPKVVDFRAEDGGPNETDGVDARAVRFPEDVSISMHSVDEITTSLQLMKSPSRQETDEVVMEECVPSNDVGDSCRGKELIGLTEWCKTVLEKRLLDTATAYFSTISSDATYIAMVKTVKDMTGNASVALAGGKKRCEFVLMLSFI